jgi:hypothetical protein
MTGSLLRLVLVLWSRFWAKAGAAALTAMPMPTAPTTRRRDNALLSFSSIAQSRALKTRRENDGREHLVAAHSGVDVHRTAG